MRITKAKLYHIIKEEVEKLIDKVNIIGMEGDADDAADAWAAASDNPGTWVVTGSTQTERGQVAQLVADDAANKPDTLEQTQGTAGTTAAQPDVIQMQKKALELQNQLKNFGT